MLYWDRPEHHTVTFFPEYLFTTGVGALAGSIIGYHLTELLFPRREPPFDARLNVGPPAMSDTGLILNWNGRF